MALPRPPMPSMGGGLPAPSLAFQQQQQQQQQQGSNKIDPSQIPRPMPFAIPTQVGW